MKRCILFLNLINYVMCDLGFRFNTFLKYCFLSMFCRKKKVSLKKLYADKESKRALFEEMNGHNTCSFLLCCIPMIYFVYVLLSLFLYLFAGIEIGMLGFVAIVLAVIFIYGYKVDVEKVYDDFEEHYQDRILVWYLETLAFLAAVWAAMLFLDEMRHTSLL